MVEPPKRRLQRELDRQRNTGPNYEAKIRSEQRREGKFRQPIPNTENFGIYDERNPPPGYDSAPPKDDIREFLDGRKANGCREAR